MTPLKKTVTKETKTKPVSIVKEKQEDISNTGITNVDTTQVESELEPIDKKKFDEIGDQSRAEESRYLRKKRLAELDEVKLRQQEQEKVAKLSKALQRLCGKGLEIIVKRLPDPETLSDTEREEFEEAAGDVLAKYLPGAFKYQEEIALTVILGAIVIPRLMPEKPSEPKLLKTTAGES